MLDQEEMHNYGRSWFNLVSQLDNTAYRIESIFDKPVKNQLERICLWYGTFFLITGDVQDKQLQGVKQQFILPTQSQAVNGLLPSIWNLEKNHLLHRLIRPVRTILRQFHIPTANRVLPFKPYLHHAKLWIQMVCLHDRVPDYWSCR